MINPYIAETDILRDNQASAMTADVLASYKSVLAFHKGLQLPVLMNDRKCKYIFMFPKSLHNKA